MEKEQPMTHPLTPQLKDLSDSDLAKKITDLNKRVVYGHQMGNPHLIQQVQMMLDDYILEQNHREQERFDKANKSAKDSGRNWDDFIDV